MYRKRERQKRIKIIVIVLLATILIFVSLLFFKDNRKLSIVESVIKDSGLFIENIVLSPVNFIKDKIDQSKDKKDLYNKYKELENKISNYESLEANNKELENEINELKETLNLNSVLSDKVALNATVINRNIGYWYDDITLDKGSNDGVLEGMPVVISKGLIGKVTKVSDSNSVVKLLTSSSNTKISVKIENSDTYVYGLLTEYDEDNHLYKIEGISETIDIPLNSLVTTTGMGDIFPSGIVVGHVSGSKSDSYDLAKIVEVTPSVSFNNLSIVTILKRNDAQ